LISELELRQSVIIEVHVQRFESFAGSVDCGLQSQKFSLISSKGLELSVNLDGRRATVRMSRFDRRLRRDSLLGGNKLPMFRAMSRRQSYAEPNRKVQAIEPGSFLDNNLQRRLRQAPIWAMNIVKSMTSITHTHATINPTTVSLFGFLISRSNIIYPFSYVSWAGSACYSQILGGRKYFITI